MKENNEQWFDFVKIQRAEGMNSKTLVARLLDTTWTKENAGFVVPENYRAELEEYKRLLDLDLGEDTAVVDKLVGDSIESVTGIDYTIKTIYERSDISDNTKKLIAESYPAATPPKTETGSDVQDSLVNVAEAKDKIEDKSKKTKEEGEKIENEKKENAARIEELELIPENERTPEQKEELDRLKKEQEALEGKEKDNKKQQEENAVELAKIKTDDEGNVQIPLRDGTAVMEKQGDKKMLRVHYGNSHIRIPFKQFALFGGDGNRVRTDINTLYIYEKMNATHRKPGLARAIFKNFENGTDPKKQHEEIARIVIEELGFKEGSRNILPGSRLNQMDQLFNICLTQDKGRKPEEDLKDLGILDEGNNLNKDNFRKALSFMRENLPKIDRSKNGGENAIGYAELKAELKGEKISLA